MQGKLIQRLDGYNGKQVWVKFANPDAGSCENCGGCGPSGCEERRYESGVYRVDGNFLVSEAEPEARVHECMPRILAIFEWTAP